ncbi:MAG TPA: fatty acid desaturase [Fimbriiglobus sp.]|nr:fatty acid desaturase [Fimbriiglobus sp.]
MTRKEFLQRLHRKSGRPFYEAGGWLALFFGLMAVSLLAWEHGYWPVSVVCWLLQAHIGHANLLAFHEAAHYLLHRDRRLNELQGIALGSLILTPLSAYRWVHNMHHTHLGTLRDTELWPFVDPSVPRWQRLLTAFGELVLGFFMTPLVFLRGVLVADKLPRATARRLVGEYALCVVTWAAILGVVAYLDIWQAFLVGYFVPSLIAGNMQTLRQYTEHMGLLGHDVPSTTRTVIDPTLAGRLLSASMLHIDLHGPHHLYSKIPHHNLGEATPVVYEEELKEPGGANVFRSYAGAIWDMVKSLGNPRVGVQWIGERKLAERPAEQAVEAA